MNMATRVQIIDEAVWISHRANVVGKSYESNNSTFNYGWIVGQTGFLTLAWQLFKEEEKENTEFKPVKLSFKLTLCHIWLVWREGLGKFI